MRCYPRSRSDAGRVNGGGAVRPASAGGRPGDEVRRSPANPEPSEGTHAATRSALRCPMCSPGCRPRCGVGRESNAGAREGGRRRPRRRLMATPLGMGRYVAQRNGARSERWAEWPLLAWHRSMSKEGDTELPAGRRNSYIFPPKGSDTSTASRRLGVTLAGAPPYPVRRAVEPVWDNGLASRGACGEKPRGSRGKSSGAPTPLLPRAADEPLSKGRHGNARPGTCSV